MDDNKYSFEKLRLNVPDIDFKADDFAFLYSGEYAEIFGYPMNEVRDANDIAGYLKIKSKNKTIYRKYHGWNIDKKKVQLTYRTLCELGLVNSHEEYVEVTPSNWFCYYYKNSNAGIKWPFRIGFYSLLLGMIPIISSIIELIYNIISYFFNCK